MTAARKILLSTVCVLLVLGLAFTQATAAEPSGQKGKKKPGASTDIPVKFEFITLDIDPPPDIRADPLGEYKHGEYGIVARMGSRSGAATLETKDGIRTLSVDFFGGFPDDIDGCDFGDCERPQMLPDRFDPVDVPANQAGMFLRIGNNVDLRSMPVDVPQPDPLHIRINTGDRDFIYLKYYPASNHKKSLCPSLSAAEEETLYASVTRLSDTIWQVEGMTARVEEYIGNQEFCRGYANMPVMFTITILP